MKGHPHVAGCRACEDDVEPSPRQFWSASIWWRQVSKAQESESVGFGDAGLVGRRVVDVEVGRVFKANHSPISKVRVRDVCVSIC